MKIFVKQLVSLFCVVFCMFFCFFTGWNEWTAIALSLVMFCGLWFEDIKLLKINKNGFEMEKLISENKKINEEINVTLEKFNNTIVPFLDFSLGLIEKDGKFDSVMEYSYIEGFVKSAYELTEETSNNSKQTEKLLQIANIKVLESFKYKVRCEYPEIYNDVDKLIITGSPIYIYDTYNISAIEVNIADLRDLANSLERSKKLLWQQDVDSLEDFYVNYIQ